MQWKLWTTDENGLKNSALGVIRCASDTHRLVRASATALAPYLVGNQVEGAEFVVCSPSAPVVGQVCPTGLGHVGGPFG